MAVYYFEDAGSNANAGTAALPKKNFDSFSPSAGDVLLINGEIRSSTAAGAVISFSGVDNLTLAQWRKSGCKPAALCGDAIITGAWTQDGTSTNVWSADIATGLALQTTPTTNFVMLGAGYRLDAFGRHAVFLTRRVFTTNTATTLAAMVAWEYYYDSAAGKLYVHIGGVSPSSTDLTRRVSWTKSGVNVATITNCDNLLVQDVSARWGNDPTAGSGYNWQVVTCLDSVWRNCESIGFGYHGFGFTTSAQVQSGHRLIDCVSHGSTNGATNFVFYADQGAVTDCKGIRCRAYMYGRLNPVGTALSTTDSITGFYSHTNDATAPNDGPFVEDVEWNNCTAFGYPDIGFAIRGYDTANAKAPRNFDDTSTYPVRVVDSTIYNGVQNLVSDTIAYVRCFLSFSNGSVSTASYSSGGGAGIFRLNRGTTLGSYYAMLESSVIECHMDTTATSPSESLFVFSTLPSNGTADQYGLTNYEARLTFTNCTIVENGAALADNIRAIFRQQNSADPRTYLRATQTLIAFATAQGDASNQFYRLVTNDGSVKDAYLTFQSCSYFNIGTGSTRWSASGSAGTGRSDRDTQTDWTASIDPTLIVPSAYPLLNGVQAVNPELTATAAASVRSVAGHANIGFNLGAYSGNYGAWQFGSTVLLSDPATTPPFGSGRLRRGQRL